MAGSLTPFVIRLVLTIGVLIVFRNEIVSIPVLVLVITFLDFFDVDLQKSVLENVEYAKTVEYQNYDKVVDLVTYYLTLILFSHMFPNWLLGILWTALIYRTYGVYNYFNSEDRTVFVMYPDVIKEVMLGYFLSGFIGNAPLFVLISALVKIVFESWHHNFDYVAAYKMLF
jgi:hypothetical protein